MATSDMELGVVGPVAVPKEGAVGEAGAATGEEGTDRCCICLSAPATCRLEPCGHRVVCDDNDCRMGVQEHGKCPLCRSAPKTMLDASGQVIFDQFKTMLPENLQGARQVTPAVLCSGLCALALFAGLYLVLIAVASVFSGLVMGAAASGRAASGSAGTGAGTGVDIALACRVSVATYSGATAALVGALVAFILLFASLIRHLPAGSRESVKVILLAIGLLGLFPLQVWVWVATSAAISSLPEPWLAAVAFGLSLVLNCINANPDDPPGTRPANRMPAQERKRRRQWNTLVYVVQHIVQAILTWAFFFQLKLERFQGRAQYEDPYGVALYGALVVGLLRVPFSTALFPAMFPYLFAVNAAVAAAP
jgi:hypothetical protein